MLTTLALTAALVTSPAETAPKDPAAAVILNLACTPFCFGPTMGYIYAGDPMRGAMVGLGMYGAGVGGYLAAGLLESIPVWMTAGTAHPLSIVDPAPTMAAGMLIGLGAYLVWSSYDVFQTTEKLNHERREHFPR